MHVDHLHRLELRDHLGRCDTAGEALQARLERDLQAVGHKRDKDMRFDPFFGAMEDRTDRQIVLRSMDACSTRAGHAG